MGTIKDITDLTRDLVNSVKDRKFIAKVTQIQNLIATLQSEHSTIIEKNADLLAENLDLKKKIEKHQSKEAILAKYDFDNRLGIRIHKINNSPFCNPCLLKNPPIESPLKVEKEGWQCLCDPMHRFPNPDYKPPAARKRPPGDWLNRAHRNR